jgi:hypothetical protein
LEKESNAMSVRVQAPAPYFEGQAVVPGGDFKPISVSFHAHNRVFLLQFRLCEFSLAHVSLRIG